MCRIAVNERITNDKKRYYLRLHSKIHCQYCDSETFNDIATVTCHSIGNL